MSLRRIEDFHIGGDILMAVLYGNDLKEHIQFFGTQGRHMVFRAGGVLLQQIHDLIAGDTDILSEFMYFVF